MFYESSVLDFATLSVLRSVVYFDGADTEPAPVLLKEISWTDVKAKIVSSAKGHS